MNKAIKKRDSERGGAGVKFLLVALVLFLVGNAGFNFVPVAYKGESFKQDMQTAVVQAVAVPTGGITPTDVVKGKIQQAMMNNDVPLDAFVEVKQVNNIIHAHVVYTKEIPIIPLGIYNHQYHFDYTATPTGFLVKQ